MARAKAVDRDPWTVESKVVRATLRQRAYQLQVGGKAHSLQVKSLQKGGQSAHSGYVYKVLVRTDRSRLRINGESRAVQSDMTVQADIVTDRRRVIEFFLSPVVRYLREGLQVR